MKKIIFCFAVALSVFSVTSFAQQGGGFERMKQMYKDSLQLTDVQSDSLLAIMQQFTPQLRQVGMDQSLSAGDKMTKLEAVHNQMKARYKAILSAEQYSKFEAMLARAQAQMRKRAPGGNYR